MASKQLTSDVRTVVGEDLVGGGRGSVEEVEPVFMDAGEVGGGRCRGSEDFYIVMEETVGVAYGGEGCGHD